MLIVIERRRGLVDAGRGSAPNLESHPPISVLGS